MKPFTVLKGLGSVATIALLVTGVMPFVQGQRNPLEPASPPISQVGTASCQKQYTVRLSNVDDRASLSIGGLLTFQSVWGRHGAQPNAWKRIGHRPGDSGWVDLTSYLLSGNNRLDFELWNQRGCCSTRVTVEVKEDNRTIFERKIARRDSSEGITWQESLTLRLADCSASTIPSA